MAYRLPPVLSLLSIPSNATRSTFSSLRTVFHFVARRQPDISFSSVPFSRFVVRHQPDVSFSSVPFPRFVARCPSDVPPPVPFSRFVVRCLPDACVDLSFFPMRRTLLVLRLYPSVPPPILTLVAISALTALSSFFRRVLLHSTNNFALWRFARKTVTLGSGLTHLCCVVCVCTFVIVLN